MSTHPLDLMASLPTTSPGYLRWTPEQVTAVARRVSHHDWTTAEFATWLEVLAFKGVRNVAAYVAAMPDADIVAWRSQLDSYAADVRAHNARWIGGAR